MQNAENTQPQNQNNNQIVFIRHAQSLSNKAVHTFRQENQLPDCWKTFHSMDQFSHQVIYNPDLCDCPISEKGQEQCKIAKQKVKDIRPDLVLVSPLERALQTCDRLFGDRQGVQIKVEPSLAQTLKYSSEISSEISGKQKRFPKYDFQSVKKQGQFWFIKNDDQDHQKMYFDHLQTLKHCTYQQKQKHIAKFMYKTHLRESPDNMRKRVRLIKLLIKEYSKKYKNIVVISHFFTIKHLMAQKVAANGEALDQFHGPNCAIHKQYLENLLKVEKQIKYKL